MARNSWLPDLKLLTLLAAWSVAQSVEAAYLRCIGPAPLRFQIPPAFVATVSMLPPLPMTEPAATSDVSDEGSVANVDDAAPVPAPAPATAPGALAESITSNEAFPVTPPLLPPAESAPSTPSAPVITPQMLIEFFKPFGGTNSGGTVIVSGAFMPPQPPPAPPSSSATYNLK